MKAKIRVDKPVTMSSFIIIKKNVGGQETWRYQGRVLERSGNRIVLEAFFDRQDMDFHGMPLLKGDRFIETYYTDRWYNIFEGHARQNDQLRGWYCNITYPAVVATDTLSYVDLVLDLLIFPDGHQILLDEEEFARLPLSAAHRQRACDALAELQSLFRKIQAGSDNSPYGN